MKFLFVSFLFSTAFLSVSSLAQVNEERGYCVSNAIDYRSCTCKAGTLTCDEITFQILYETLDPKRGELSKLIYRPLATDNYDLTYVLNLNNLRFDAIDIQCRWKSSLKLPTKFFAVTTGARSTNTTLSFYGCNLNELDWNFLKNDPNINVLNIQKSNGPESLEKFISSSVDTFKSIEVNVYGCFWDVTPCKCDKMLDILLCAHEKLSTVQSILGRRHSLSHFIQHFSLLEFSVSDSEPKVPEKFLNTAIAIIEEIKMICTCPLFNLNIEQYPFGKQIGEFVRKIIIEQCDVSNVNWDFYPNKSPVRNRVVLKFKDCTGTDDIMNGNVSALDGSPVYVDDIKYPILDDVYDEDMDESNLDDIRDGKSKITEMMMQMMKKAATMVAKNVFEGLMNKMIEMALKNGQL